MTIPHDAIRDELENQRRRLLNRVDQIIERALCNLVRAVFNDVDAVKQLQQARDLRDEWQTAVFTEFDDLVNALERADGALLREVNKAGTNGNPCAGQPPPRADINEGGKNGD
jgi:hypothetical protein